MKRSLARDALGALLLLSLAVSLPAQAQDEAPPDPAAVSQGAAAPEAQTPTTTGTATSAGTATSTATTSTATTTSTGTGTGTGTGSSAAQPAVVVRHVRSDDDEDEAPQDPGDPYDILWIELFGGVSYVDLRAVDTTNFYPEFVRLAGWGGAGGAALGFRIEFVSVGVRGAFAHYDVSDAASPDAIFDVGTLAAEVKLAIPLPVVQPFIRAGFGFAWHGDSNAEEAWETRMPPSDIETTVFGWVFQGAIGVDVYLAHWFAIGAAFSVDILNMNRQTWDEEPSDPRNVMFRNAGDAVGAQGRGQLAISFHL